jgi:hypothetical protein
MGSPSRATTSVTASRRYWTGTALALAFGTYLGVGNAIQKGGAGYVIWGLVFAVLCAICVRMAVRRPVEFSVNERGFVLGAGKRAVPWEDVSEIRLGLHQSAYEEEHHLVLTLKQKTPPTKRRLITTNATNPSEVDVSLDHLSVSWQEIIRSVESVSGKTVGSVREGPFRLGAH